MYSLSVFDMMYRWTQCGPCCQRDYKQKNIEGALGSRKIAEVGQETSTIVLHHCIVIHRQSDERCLRPPHPFLVLSIL